MVDPLFGSDRNARWNVTDGARYRRHDHVVQNRYRFVARHHEDGPMFVIRRFQEPQLALGYQGSASVIAMAFVKAS